MDVTVQKFKLAKEIFPSLARFGLLCPNPPAVNSHPGTMLTIMLLQWRL